MDPNEALRMLREFIDADPDDYEDDDLLDLIKSSFRSLDEWISKGGFLPDEWDRQDAKDEEQ